MKNDIITLAVILATFVAGSVFLLSAQTPVSVEALVGYGSVLALIGVAALEYRVSWNWNQELPNSPNGNFPGGSLDNRLTGTYRLNFQGQQTVAIAWNASPATVETALQNLPNIENVDVFLDGNNDTVVEFLGDLAVTNVDQLTVTSQLVGGSVSISTNKSGAAFVGEARFDLPSGSFVFTPGQADVVIHPLFKNISATN